MGIVKPRIAKLRSGKDSDRYGTDVRCIGIEQKGKGYEKKREVWEERR